MTENAKYSRLFAKYGNPMENHRDFEREFMTMWNVPMYLDTHIPALPNRIYINRDIVQPFETVLERLISMQVYKEIKTFDGMFNIRYIRGSKNKLSIHSWGLAVDFNATHNPLGFTKEAAKAKGLNPFTTLFDEIWRDTGWTCGIDFSRADGMHFEYTRHL